MGPQLEGLRGCQRHRVHQLHRYGCEATGRLHRKGQHLVPTLRCQLGVLALLPMLCRPRVRQLAPLLLHRAWGKRVADDHICEDGSARQRDEEVRPEVAVSLEALGLQLRLQPQRQGVAMQSSAHVVMADGDLAPAQLSTREVSL